MMMLSPELQAALETAAWETRECPPAGTGPDGVCTTCAGIGTVLRWPEVAESHHA